MSSRIFPRKEIYVCTFDQPLSEGRISATIDREIELSADFLKYCNEQWNSDNVGWVSSSLPSAVEIESDQEGTVKIHCGLSEYKYILGQFKLALSLGRSSSEFVHGLSTEMFPLTLDETFILEQRSSDTTQHAVGFCDIPTAGQSAEIYLDAARRDFPNLSISAEDLFGFARYNLMQHFGLRLEEIGKIGYVGFSKGFECSIDSQINGYVDINCEGREIITRSESKDNGDKRLLYKFGDILDVLDSIGNQGKEKVKEDLQGRIPGVTSLTNNFGIVDVCLGTLLNILWHKNNNQYHSALDILDKKGYQINEIKLGPESKIILDDLN